MSSHLPCQACGILIYDGKGVVCANYGHKRPLSGLCKGAWHARCYRQTERDRFPVLRASDLDDAMLTAEDLKEDDPDRFKLARESDHLMCPFQCDRCHFVNIQGRIPGERHQDTILMDAIRRANLDAFWSRESSTVKANLGEHRRVVRLSERLGIQEPYPPRGPYPERDIFGMRLACMSLLRSMDTGVNTETIQFETVRKLRSHFSNFCHATPEGTGAATVSDSRGATFFSMSPSNSYWFRRFMQGMHRRMGDVWIPDRALSLDEMLHMMVILEEDWANKHQDAVGRLETSLLACALLGTFGNGLRGEELMRTELGEIRQYWEESLAHPTTPHVPWVMSGRFKQVVGEKLYFQPMAIRSRSGLEYKKWMERMIYSYNVFGIKTGPVFRVAGGKPGDPVRRSSVGDLDPPFHDLLKRVQERFPNVIHPSVKISDEFSLRRSGRRGSTINAQNQDVPKEVIEANNGWRKHMRSKGMLPNMSMVERYSDAKASVTTLIKYTAAH